VMDSLRTHFHLTHFFSFPHLSFLTISSIHFHIQAYHALVSLLYVTGCNFCLSIESPYTLIIDMVFNFQSHGKSNLDVFILELYSQNIVIHPQELEEDFFPHIFGANYDVYLDLDRFDDRLISSSLVMQHEATRGTSAAGMVKC